MIRTQVQLTEEQVQVLRALSAERNVSMAELIRNSIDDFVSRQQGRSRDEIVARAKRAVGMFSSDSSDGSVEHDRYFAEAIASK